jgi:hypothetical protein
VIRVGITVLALIAAGVCAAQPLTNDLQSAPAKPKHFRLTFVLTYPDGQHPTQSFALDVPVMANRPGMSSMMLSAGTTGQDDGSVQENLHCTEVRESATGLAAKISFSLDRVSKIHLPSGDEPLHNQVTFEHKIDVVLGQSTPITDEPQQKPLGKGDGSLPTAPAPPQITVTATVI